MSPKIVNKEEKKTEIALLALEVFVEKGFERTSISAIAQKAGIAKGSVYDYFSSKEDLIYHTIKLCLRMLEEKEVEVAKEEDAESQLRAFIQGAVQAWFADQRIVRISVALFHMMLSDQMPLPYKQMMFRHLLKASTIIERIIHKGVEQGIFRKDLAPDAGDISINLLAFMDGISLYYFIDREKIDISKHIEIYLDSFMRGLRT